MRNVHAALTVFGCLTIQACSSDPDTSPFIIPLTGEPINVPAGVAYLERIPEQFEQPEEHPLFSVPAGTVIDDLQGLTGCWGAAYSKQFLDAGFEFYFFDLEAREMVYQVLSRGSDELFGVDVAVDYLYSLAFVGADRITVELQSFSATGNVAGVPDVSFSCQDVSDCVEELPVFTLLVTLQGESFKFGDSEDASPDFSGPHRASLVFFQFECPE